MKVKSFEVIGLLLPDNKVSAQLSADLNILTGRNGAGKTSLLKLLWYIMSGNILEALHEVVFQKATLITDAYECTLMKLSRATCKVELTIGGQRFVFEDQYDEDGDTFVNAEDEANTRLVELGSSVFFPTFRRIEGGFTLSNPQPPSLNTLSGRTVRSKNPVEEALLALSRKLTNGSHVFVAAISTVDIVGLLLRQYADLSDTYNRVQESTSQNIIETIKAHKADPKDVKQAEAANTVLDQIRSKIERMEFERERIMTPIDAVRKLVEKLFRYTGIKIGARLSFGDAASGVNSDALSAGEKQMLSFICYNAFYKDSVIFIDEPELSLHVDWQRQLFSILQDQQSSNQFIVATHSPFIYSKYPDKEVNLNFDRGDLES